MTHRAVDKHRHLAVASRKEVRNVPFINVITVVLGAVLSQAPALVPQLPQKAQTIAGGVLAALGMIYHLFQDPPKLS